MVVGDGSNVIMSSLSVVAFWRAFEITAIEPMSSMMAICFILRQYTWSRPDCESIQSSKSTSIEYSKLLIQNAKIAIEIFVLKLWSAFIIQGSACLHPMGFNRTKQWGFKT